jgi:hypothetical protein
MKFIERNQLDVSKWDRLVKTHSKNVFNLSNYLDITAENWCVLITNDFSAGIAIPYTARLGIRTAYTPYFTRYVEWLGESCDSKQLLSFLKGRFKVGSIQIKSLHFGGAQKKHQYLLEEQLNLTENTKRQLKKAQQFPIFKEVQLERLMNLVSQELTKKVPTLNSKTLPILLRVAQQFENNGLHQFNIYDGKELAGAAWFIENEHKVLYLKGACSEHVKKQGGMYRLLFEGISYTFSKGKIFDFGGSNVQGVREFNLKFGAKDALYGLQTWNNAPWWWNLIKALKN